MKSLILYCPHLKRDLSSIRARVPGVELMYGKRTLKGQDGCLRMHKEATRAAREAKVDALFVMEDDCAFTAAFDWERWQQQAAWAKAAGYDVLVGGSIRTDRPRLVAPGLVAVSAFRSAHCLVYFPSSYSKVQAAIQPYDYSLGRDCRVKAVVTVPFVAVQRPSFSGILKKHVDYLPEYRRHETDLYARFPMLREAVA